MKLALIGVGMIGGSLAAALRRAGKVTDVIGYDSDPAALASAQRMRVIDAIAASMAAAVGDAQVVAIATPVGAIAEVLKAIAPALALDAIVTDVGSTKANVVAAAREALGAHLARFVPGHPIAGKERPGVAHADAGLFAGRLAITTPLAETDAQALAWVEAAWRACGARVERMDVDEHDRVFAAVSHLPHLLAFALVARIAGELDGERKLGFAGAGFRDFTRIAAGSSTMWRDIAIANRVALGEELRGYRALLDELQRAIDAGDRQAIERVFDLASLTRRRHAKTFDAE